jgi:carboxypeptidase D
MRLSTALVLAASACGALARSPLHAGKRILSGYTEPAERMQTRSPTFNVRGSSSYTTQPKHMTPKTKKYYVDGTKIPDVDFDIGESYAGLMPISGNKGEKRQLYFWYFPSENKLADDEITIWLNGGPGCSSLEGFLQENGPFLWQYGTFKPFPNPWAWNNLTNMVWVEQPVGTGFSQGTPNAKSEEDVAAQFLGFFKQFVDTFALQGKKVYIAGESYAGYVSLAPTKT